MIWLTVGIQPTSPNPPPPNYYAAQPPPPGTTTSATLVSEPPPPGGEAPIYTKWWFWTGIGVVAVLAGVTIYAITQSGGTTRPECTASGGCM